MQNSENIESDQSCHLVSPCYTSCTSKWNAIRSKSSEQSCFTGLNLNRDSHAQNLDTKQLHHQQGRDSSLTLSNCQSHDGSKIRLIGNQNELSNSKESGCDETHRNPSENCVKSTIPFGTSEIISQVGKNYAHSASCLSFPYADPYYGAVLTAYGPQAILHPQMLGMATARIPLPPYFTEEEPIYVNPKQYHGILRRRQHRAKLEVQNKLVKNRKPYLHESRHLHAMKRVRGSGGRFLNTRELQQCNPTSSSDGKKTSTSSSLRHVGEDASMSESDNANTGTSTPSGSDLTSASNSENNPFQQPDIIYPTFHFQTGRTINGDDGRIPYNNGGSGGHPRVFVTQ